MSIELITGYAGRPHISSNDIRSINRGIFGKGRYIIKDADDMAVTISPAVGTLSIAPGSVIWSGMHIRNAEELTLNYAVPAGTQNYYVYFYYAKDADNNFIESVEVVISTEEKTTTDVLNDSTVDAYTLFYKFTQTASSIVSQNYNFDLIASIEDFDYDNVKALVSTTETNAKKHADAKASEAEINAKNYTSSLVNSESAKAKNYTDSSVSSVKNYTDSEISKIKANTVLFNGLQSLSSGATIVLSQPYYHFTYLAMQFRSSSTDFGSLLVPVCAIHGGAATNHFALNAGGLVTKLISASFADDSKKISFNSESGISITAIWGLF